MKSNQSVRVDAISNKKMRISAVLAGMFSGWASYCALKSTPADASGWWQVAIALAGLPIFFHGLARIEEEVRKAQWKPEIIIGLFGLGPLSFIRKDESLPAVISTSQGYPCFQLVVRNRGKLAAKYVKIHLEFESFEDDSFRASAISPNEQIAVPSIKIPEDNPFKWQNNKDFIFTGGADWVIYPHDEVVFTFFLETIVVGQPPVPHDYYFRCTVWAEGLDGPAKKDLTVRVTRKHIDK